MKRICTIIALTMCMLMFTVTVSAEKKEKGKESFLKSLNDKSKIPAWNKDGKLFSPDKSKTAPKELTVEDFTEIELPYEQTHVYKNEYIVHYYDEWDEEYYYEYVHGVPLKLTITEEKTINACAFNSEWGNVTYFILYKDGVSALDMISYTWPPEFAGTLTPGTYYFFIHDAHYYEYFEEYLTCTISFSESEIIYYKDLDYSTLVPATKLMNRSTPFIDIGEVDVDYETVRGLSFSAEVVAGNAYFFTFEFSTSIIYTEQEAILAILDGNLSYEDFEDNLLAVGVCYGYMTSEFNSVVYFSATKTETVKLLFIPMVCYSDITVTIGMKEAEPPITLFEMLDKTDKTITYSENMSFMDIGKLGDENSFLVAGEDYLFGWDDEYYFAVPYKISLLTGDFIEIRYHQADDALLYMYKKNGTEYELISVNDDHYYNNYDSYIYFIAKESGDYYIVGSTYNEMTTGRYVITVENKIVNNTISLFDMLDQTEKTINYSENLSFTDYGIFGNGTSFLVEGDDDLFRWSDDNFYAVPYKISLKPGDVIELHHSSIEDAYLYIYQKTEYGYELVDYNDDGYGDEGDSYINFFAYEAADYYIVCTTYDDMSTGFYFLSVWNTGEEPDHKYFYLTQLCADKTSIIVPKDAKEIDILRELANIEITGVFNDDYKISLPNSPFYWHISASMHLAVFLPSDYYYYGEELVIAINFESGINKSETTPSILAYTNDKTIYVNNAPNNTIVKIFDIAGRMIKSGRTIDSTCEIKVEKSGIYIVQAGNKAIKVIVR